MHYVYVLQSEKDGDWYIGSTKDLKRRLLQHNRGENKSTNNRRPFKVVYYEASESKSSALRREKYLKTAYGHRYLRSRLERD
ncbi:MAG: GIY-YIG nuclease family protein [Kiritimatiellales bacterium]|nr:GIY-YIG nuclease family protein [Kiritimatiellota bacterium]MBL7016180.1 GIY-YIG nuclease family protein [Kiritimatiellales bacterium]